AIVFWAVEVFLPPLPPNSLGDILTNVLFLVFVGSLLVAQIYRYRYVSNAGQRQQTKWVVFGISIGLGGLLLVNTFLILFPSLIPQSLLTNLITSTVLCFFLLLFPLSIGIAILRSR